MFDVRFIKPDPENRIPDKESPVTKWLTGLSFYLEVKSEIITFNL
jgi:hypothetical protein